MDEKQWIHEVIRKLPPCEHRQQYHARWKGCSSRWTKQLFSETKQQMKEKLLKLLASLPEDVADDVCGLKYTVLNSINGLLSSCAECQFLTFDTDEADKYEEILNVSVDISLHTIIYDIFVKCQASIPDNVSCESLEKRLEAGLVDYSQTHEIYSKTFDTCKAALCILVHIAAGAKENRAKLMQFNFHRYAEVLFLQRCHDDMSLMALQALSGFMSENSDYAIEIGKSNEFHIRSHQLFVVEATSEYWKGWILFFWDWAIHVQPEIGLIDRCRLHVYMSACNAVLQSPEPMALESSTGLLRNIFENKYFNVVLLQDREATLMLEESIPILLNLFTHHHPSVVQQGVSTLTKILEALEPMDYQFDLVKTQMQKRGFLYLTIPLLYSDDGKLVRDAMDLLFRFVSKQTKVVIEWEEQVQFLTMMLSFLNSGQYMLCSRAVCVLYEFLRVDDDSREIMHIVLEYVVNRPQLLLDIVRALRSVDALLQQVEHVDSLSDEEKCGSVLVDFGMRSVELIIYIANDVMEERQDEIDEVEGEEDGTPNFSEELQNAINSARMLAELLLTEEFMSFFVAFREMDLTKYTGSEGDNSYNTRHNESIDMFETLLRSLEIRLPESLFTSE